MTLNRGSRLGPYEIVAPLGAGGMGEVYRARDAKLGRDVAIKVLLPTVANDPDRLLRFSREAQVLAALNHPNIAHIHGLEEAGGVTALVLELVEGEDLAQRIARGAIPLDEALPIARQIADALEAAHEQGIIHRDLKPANIKVRADGTVKVLDFGLAKAMDPTGTSSANAMNSPTLSMHATQAGIILGTAAYMSPEQARGSAVDRRADVWAFGVVLYEMLAGAQLFEGPTVSDTLAAVLRADPDWSKLPADTPVAIRRVLRRCLEKDPKRRLQAVGDARLELDDALTDPAVEASVGSVVVQPAAWRRVLPWAAASALGLASVILAALLIFRGTPSEPATISFDVVTPSGPSLQFAVSPTGKYLVASSAGDQAGTQALWLRSLDQVRGKMLAGTEGESFPFWSPDGKFIAFFAGDKLKKIDVSGAPPQVLADVDVSSARGGTWNRDDVILFGAPTGLLRVTGSGGTPTPVTELDRSRQEMSHRYPSFLPDGRHFLYLAVSQKPENSGIYVGTLDSHERKRLVGSEVKAEFAAPDRLLFARIGAERTDATLMAQRFDPARLVLEGDPLPVAEGVGVNTGNSMAGFTISGNGILAYRAGGNLATVRAARLTWLDRSGQVLGTLAEPGGYRNPRLSPDGARVVVEAVDSSRNRDLWLIDARGVATRFTFDPGVDAGAVWSPDGSRVAWTLGSGGYSLLYQKASNGIGKEEKLPLDASGWVIDEWLRGEALLLHPASGPSMGLRLAPLTGGGGPSMIGDARAVVTHARVSPDGHWVAFTGNDSGKSEIYVQNFPTPAGRWRVSTGGGIQPVWRRDGNELFYIAPDGKLMAAPLKLTQTADPGTPVALFDTHMEGGGTQTSGIWHQYDVTPDGKRFLVNTLVEQPSNAAPAASAPITVVVNWQKQIAQ